MFPEQSTADIIGPEVIENIKLDLYYLIRRYCVSYNITRFRRKLFLHDSTPIEYVVIDVEEVERLFSIVDKCWFYFPYLISNLSYDEERVSTDLKDRVIGSIDFPKTAKLRMNRQTDSLVTCISSGKNIFTPENILLASLILGINLLASKFLKAGIDNEDLQFKAQHKLYLQKIIDYTQFLLNDRVLKKLVDSYLLNYENSEQLLVSINQRMNQGKVRSKYFLLFRLIQLWKNLGWIVNEHRLSLYDALTPFFDSIAVDRLYEMWIFYKIVSLFEPISQRKRNVNLFVSNKDAISVEYHKRKNLGWTLEKKDGIKGEVIRIPDISIRQNGRYVAIIDAKCIRYSEKTDGDGMQELGPEGYIVNQMIIYLDYDNKCDLGIVLFADDKIREDVIIKKGDQKIVFLNCYPYHESASLAFEKISGYLTIK